MASHINLVSESGGGGGSGQETSRGMRASSIAPSCVGQAAGSRPGAKKRVEVRQLENILSVQGSVADEDVPSKRPDEVRSLGITMHPVLARYFKDNMDRWNKTRKAKSKAWKDQIVVKEPENLFDQGKTLQRALKILMEQIAERSGLAHNPGMKDLPEDFPLEGATEGYVSGDDLRVPLRGQRGLFATNDLEPGCVIGTYRGYLNTDSQHNHLKYQPHKDFPEEGFSRVSKWEELVECFCVNDDKFIFTTEINGKQVPLTLFLDGVGYGNGTALVNDCTVYPMGMPDDLKQALNSGEDDDGEEDQAEIHELSETDRYEDYYDSAAKVQQGMNCRLYNVEIRGWPYLFLIVTKHIKAGEELLTQYGHLYWALVQDIYQKRQSEQENLLSRGASTFDAAPFSEPCTYSLPGSSVDGDASQSVMMTAMNPGDAADQEFDEVEEGEAFSGVQDLEVVEEVGEGYGSDGDSAEGPAVLDPGALPARYASNDRPNVRIQRGGPPMGDDDGDDEDDVPCGPPISRRGPLTMKARKLEDWELDPESEDIMQRELKIVSYMAHRKNGRANLNQIRCAHDMNWPKGQSLYQFITLRPHLFDPVVGLPCHEWQTFELKDGKAQELLCTQYLDYFQFHLFKMKLRMLSYMAKKRQPRLDITELNQPGVKTSEVERFMKMYVRLEDFSKHHLQDPDTGNFRPNKYDSNAVTLELGIDTVKTLRRRLKEWQDEGKLEDDEVDYDPGTCKPFRDKGSCPGKKKCPLLHDHSSMNKYDSKDTTKRPLKIGDDPAAFWSKKTKSQDPEGGAYGKNYYWKSEYQSEQLRDNTYKQNEYKHQHQKRWSNAQPRQHQNALQGHNRSSNPGNSSQGRNNRDEQDRQTSNR